MVIIDDFLYSFVVSLSSSISWLYFFMAGVTNHYHLHNWYVPLYPAWSPTPSLPCIATILITYKSFYIIHLIHAIHPCYLGAIKMGCCFHLFHFINRAFYWWVSFSLLNPRQRANLVIPTCLHLPIIMKLHDSCIYIGNQHASHLDGLFMATGNINTCLAQ